jgi:ACS family D-galactonate transporter-like MFS transporter
MVRFGWRWSFAATGFLSLFYFFLFYLFYRNPSEDKSLSAAERDFIRQGGARSDNEHAEAGVTATKGAPLGYLLRQRKVWGLVLGFASYNYTFYLLLTWLPSYLSSAHRIDLLHSTLYASAPWFFATFTDLLMGGWLVDKLIQRGRDASLVRQAILIGGTTLGLGLLAAAYAHTATAAVLWIAIALGGLSAAAPVAWSVPSLVAPRDSVGTLGGILNFGSQLSAIAAPIVTGYIAQATHSFLWAFGVAAAFLVVGIAGYGFLLGRIETISEPS